MRKRHRTLIGLALTLAAAAFSGVLPLSADAPNAAKATGSVTMELKDIEVRSALEALFRNTGKNFSIDGNVDGMIPALSFMDVPFDAALKNLLKSTGLVYRIESNVYVITKRPDAAGESAMSPKGGCYGPSPDVEATEARVEKIPLNYSSPREILDMMTNSGRQYGGAFNPGIGNTGYGGIYGNNINAGGGYRPGMKNPYGGGCMSNLRK